MKIYNTENIRNIGFFGHGGTGKTTACEAMLFHTRAIDRFGKVNDGNTTSDFDADEMKRGMSIYTSTIPIEFKKNKFNILDTPGFLDFIAQVESALRVVETSVYFVSGQAGVEVGLERVWKMSKDLSMAKIFFINRLDKENSNFYKTFDSIQETLKISDNLIPLTLPIGEAEKFTGVVNLLNMKAYTYKDGKAIEGEIPAEVADKAEEYREKLVEASAGVDEALMEKYFEGELTDEDIIAGFSKGIKSGSLSAVICGSAEKSIGIDILMDAFVNYCPNPVETGDVKAFKPKSDEEVILKGTTDEPFSSLVFKTTTDPYVGRLSVLRVYSGVLTPDTIVYNPKKDREEKISNLMIFCGKNHDSVDKINAGDMVTVAKLADTATSDTLCSKEQPVQFPEITFSEPLMSLAVYPKSKGDEDKLSGGLSKLIEEDPTFRVFRDPVTKETVISGVGDLQLNIIMDRLKRKFGVEVELTTPKIPYQETIKGSTKSEYKHKKQSGGRGQYGHVCLEFEPNKGKGYEFVDKIVGGVVPKNYIPAVDKGLKKAMDGGVIAGYPVVDFKATLYFGSYHTVDSSDMAFQIAAAQAFKKGIVDAKPILLEPIYEVEIIVPDSFTGDVIGDLNSRRGRIQGMDPLGDGMQSIKANVPQAEMLRYAIDLRSITQGRGVFNMKFHSYEEVPAQIAEGIIAEAKKDEES